MASKKILSIILLLVPFASFAQEKSLNTWVTGTLNKQVHKWDFTLECEYRSIGIFEKLSRFSIQPEITYSFSKFVKLGTSYSIMSVYDSKYDDYQWRNRYAIFGEGRLKSGRFTWKLREKFELTTKDESDRIRDNGEKDTYRINPDEVWRNKLKISYNIPKVPIEPSIAFESFYQLNNPDGNVIEKLRYSLFLGYKFSKNQEIEIYSHLNNELTDSASVKTYVVGIGYTYSL